ncbi:MAG TPA: DUF4142 domain-containing protein [Phycisphaerales bacterium]|nr:DUF4142 domain-containing protein [Phycisphaerales bacterium]
MSRNFPALLALLFLAACQSRSCSNTGDQLETRDQATADTPGDTTRPSKPGQATDGPSNMTEPNPNNNSPDARLLSILHVKDGEEVRIGRLAEERAQSQPAKDFAQMLVKDHGDHQKEVAGLAKSIGIQLWDEATVKAELNKDKPADERVDPMERLQSLTGKEFDAEFGAVMLKGHRELIALVQAAQPSLRNEDVRRLVEKTLPVLRHHEEMAAKISESSQAGGPE